LNAPTLNFLLSPTKISLNIILSFLFFFFVRLSSLISVLHISKSKKFFTTYFNSKRVIICMVKKPYTSKAKIYYWNIIFLSFTFTLNPTPKCVTILIYSIFFIQLI